MEGILDFCMLENLRWRLCSVDILVDPFGRYNTCVEINLLPLVREYHPHQSRVKPNWNFTLFFRESSPQGSPKINYIDHIYFLYFNSWRNEVFIPGVKIIFMCGAFIIILKTNSRKSLAICADLSALYPVVLATSAATVIKHRGHDYHFTEYLNPSSPRLSLSVIVSYFILLIWRGQRWPVVKNKLQYWIDWSVTRNFTLMVASKASPWVWIRVGSKKKRKS